MAIEKQEKVLKAALEAYELFLKKLQEEYKKGMGSSTYSTALHNSIETANKGAYDVYKQTKELNDAKSDAASKEYDKTSDELSKQYNGGSGTISREEYTKAMDEAYEKYRNIKHENDRASDTAYDEYKQNFNNNISLGKEVQEAQTKKNDSILSVPSGSISTPTAKAGDALGKIAEERVSANEVDNTPDEPQEKSGLTH